MPKNIVILGATGSIGTQTLDVVRRLPKDLRVIGLSAFRNQELLRAQAQEFGVPASALEYGDEADLVRLARLKKADLVVVAVAGAIGILATLAALDAGKDVALATKEVLVAAGEIVMDLTRVTGTLVLPIDSEHSAIFQCIQGSDRETIQKLWLTASGGPFRTWTQEQIAGATLAEAMQHPTWPTMGRKITVDSATMMNKGLETIEAHWLFQIPMEQIGIVVHPQSVIHSMVEFTDGSLLAQLGLPDMRLPIQYALLYPERSDTGLPRLDPTQMGTLTFEAPDETRFPCLRLARQAAQAGGTIPTVLNAANEAAVAAFLAGAIPFRSIPELIEQAMEIYNPIVGPMLAQIGDADQWTRRWIKEQVYGRTA